MKFVTLAALAFGLGLTLSANGSPKTLTADPLTNLPLYPATDSRLHLGNAPTRLPDSHMCKSTMQTDFYAVFDSKVDATVAWYAAHLNGFKKTHAYANNRSQDTFYNADGSLIVSITGNPGKPDENTDTHGLVYARFQPGISEKTILGMNQQKVICQ
ncbi:MAG TPA: hypothetical protein VHW45_07825 [Candidatus Sulfotelmatobacter sp.]|jgi:hypothetical protein|nr:hypothetical protein [Candidatus Sulfotelmatobacter sp.]